MKLILTKDINYEIITRLEYLNHLKLSYQFIMGEILRKRSPYKYDKENVDYYMDKLSKVMTEFNIISSELVKEIDKKYLNNKLYYSEFNFEEGVLNIYEK